MSRHGNFWNYTPQESLFDHMKDEIHLEQCHMFIELYSEIDTYMDYYNNDRYQWEIAKLSLNQYVVYLRAGAYSINV